MADISTTSRKLKLVFKKADGNKVTQNYNYAAASPGRTNVKTLMSTIIANRAVFQQQPTSEVSADIVTTTKVAYDLA